MLPRCGRRGGLGGILVLLGLDLLGRRRRVAVAGEGGRRRLGRDHERLRVLRGDLLQRDRFGGARGRGGEGRRDRDRGDQTADGGDGDEAADGWPLRRAAAARRPA
jgi:hypothetical protein